MATGPAPGERGLSATELAAAVAELQVLRGAEVRDAALVDDDLLLVLQQAGQQQKQFLHLAPGSRRGRITVTRRRFAAAQQRSGPRVDAVRRLLVGCRLEAIGHEPGERRCTLRLGAAAEPLRLELELFAARGLWAVCRMDGTICELSRPVTTAVRTLQPGLRYEPPPRAAAAAEPPPRFAAPVLDAIDDHYTAQDLAAATTARRDALARAAARGEQRLQRKIEGLRQQLAAAAEAAALRAEADLMLAYAHTAPRGATVMTVPDPERDGAQRTIPLDPAKPAHQQAQERYERARRLEAGRAVASERLLAAEQQAAALRQASERLAEPTPLGPDEQQAIESLLHGLGALPRSPAAAEVRPKRPAGDRRLHDLNLRRFRSAEDYEILVGRDNEQNDKLTLRVAKGNDIWLHVGGGRAGSHVVIRLPKGKTASLETLLDAGTLAVHFSKARGEHLIEVIYTFAKHVRKPKGMPPGAVVPARFRTLAVRRDEARLQRLLASADGEPEPGGR